MPRNAQSRNIATKTGNRNTSTFKNLLKIPVVFQTYPHGSVLQKCHEIENVLYLHPSHALPFISTVSAISGITDFKKKNISQPLTLIWLLFAKTNGTLAQVSGPEEQRTEPNED